MSNQETEPDRNIVEILNDATIPPSVYCYIHKLETGSTALSDKASTIEPFAQDLITRAYVCGLRKGLEVKQEILSKIKDNNTLVDHLINDVKEPSKEVINGSHCRIH